MTREISNTPELPSQPDNLVPRVYLENNLISDNLVPLGRLKIHNQITFARGSLSLWSVNPIKSRGHGGAVRRTRYYRIIQAAREIPIDTGNAQLVCWAAVELRIH